MWVNLLGRDERFPNNDVTFTILLWIEPLAVIIVDHLDGTEVLELLNRVVDAVRVYRVTNVADVVMDIVARCQDHFKPLVVEILLPPINTDRLIVQVDTN